MNKKSPLKKGIVLFWLKFFYTIIGDGRVPYFPVFPSHQPNRVEEYRFVVPGRTVAIIIYNIYILSQLILCDSVK